MKQNNQDLQEARDVYLKATTSHEEKAIRARVNQLVQNSTNNNSAVELNIKELRQQVGLSKQTHPQSVDTRRINTSEQALTTLWNTHLNHFQQVQLAFQKGLKDKIKRQTKLVDSTLSEQQVEDICKDPQKAQELLQQKMLGGTSVTMQNVITDIQDKYKDIQKIEESVEMIFNLFKDLAVLVQQQGEAIDNIELNIDDAHNYVVGAE